MVENEVKNGTEIYRKTWTEIDSILGQIFNTFSLIFEAFSMHFWTRFSTARFRNLTILLETETLKIKRKPWSVVQKQGFAFSRSIGGAFPKTWFLSAWLVWNCKDFASFFEWVFDAKIIQKIINNWFQICQNSMEKRRPYKNWLPGPMLVNLGSIWGPFWVPKPLRNR